MYSFNNDYSEGAHPRILEAMLKSNLIQQEGYSTDEHTFHAIKCIKTELGRQDPDIHILPGGTQTNLIAICTALKPHQAVIAATTGHINVHETGAIEATGHKVLTCTSDDGKLTPTAVQIVLDHHTDEHMVQPKMVYISNSTEVGTLYTKSELQALSVYCRQNDLYLFMDGARLGSALTSQLNDLLLSDIVDLVDVFYIGGTKNGALFGESLIICNSQLKNDIRYIIKQKGALLAKGWLLGIQFEELFQNNLFYDLAQHANEKATQLTEIIRSSGYDFLYQPGTNQLFPIFPDHVIVSLNKDFLFSYYCKIDETHSAVRLVTSWATTAESLKLFEQTLKSL